MDYLQDSFPFPPQHPNQHPQHHHHHHHHHQQQQQQQQQQHLTGQQPQLYYQPMAYPTYMLQQPSPIDEMYMAYPSADYVDYMHPGMMREDYDEMGEISTRPRLTKEQVEVLEAQFQAQPKPNSAVKHQLAIQTKLSLARVANWFQNRRAKAKQMRKQEEFENAQALGQIPSQQVESAKSAESTESSLESQLSTSASSTSTTTPADQPSASDVASASSSISRDSSMEAGWASVQRAVNAAETAQQRQRTHQQTEDLLSMPPPELPHASLSRQLSLRNGSLGQASTMQDLSDWSVKPTSAKAWSSPQAAHEPSFDFAFEPLDVSATSSHSAEADASPEDFEQTYMLSPELWQEPLSTPKGISQQTMDQNALAQSPGMSLPSYSDSRRGSAADELTTNFGSFALAGSSPHPMANLTIPDALRQSDGQVDLAARRKRPRPAALTSASLRSRSYGALTSVSPTFRPGVTTPGAHTVRHVKSQGHGLNAHYSGIRKASCAQRSPMNVSSFAEAEAFHRLMAQQAAVTHSPSTGTPSNESPSASFPSESMINAQISPAEQSSFMSHGVDLASQYQLAATQHLTLSAASPPTTPFGTEFINPGLMSSSMPLSAPPQYASFPDYTPPYSAGPLTNSSWSDAPLTSPELPNFPSLTYNPSMSLSPHQDSLTGQFQHFVLPSDLKPELGSNGSYSDHKTTEFWIHEFPNQKKEHAQVAQQLAQQKPKNYVFANTAPSDYNHGL